MKKLLIVAALLLTGCNVSDRFVSVAEVAKPKTVMISVTATLHVTELVITEKGIKIQKSNREVRILGSGVFITPNGHVLTVNHLFNAGKIHSITVRTLNGDNYAAEILYQQDFRDLALIKVNPDRPVAFAALADPDSMKVGQEVVAVGNPLGLDWTVTTGVISALHRDLFDRKDQTQADAAINGGNSGGPLFNLRGELVGINSFMISPSGGPIFTGLGFSVSPNQITKFLSVFDGLNTKQNENTSGLKEALGWK